MGIGAGVWAPCGWCRPGANEGARREEGARRRRKLLGSLNAESKNGYETRGAGAGTAILTGQKRCVHMWVCGGRICSVIRQEAGAAWEREGPAGVA